MSNSDNYKIIVDTCEPDKAKQRMENWLESHQEIKKNLKPDDIIVDHVLTDVNGRKICYRRYRIINNIFYDFERLKSLFEWNPIPNCPGRYILNIGDKSLSMSEILGCELKTSEYKLDTARDLILISMINDGGIISYKRTDGTYVHTLNTMDGFIRKLNNLGIKNCS